MTTKTAHTFVDRAVGAVNDLVLYMTEHPGVLDRDLTRAVEEADQLLNAVQDSLVSWQEYTDDDQHRGISPQPVVASSALSGDAVDYLGVQVEAVPFGGPQGCREVRRYQEETTQGIPTWLYEQLHDPARKQEFGDVDYGPSHGIRYTLSVPVSEDDGEVGDAVWQYFTRNYEDQWQEHVVRPRMGATPDTLVVDLFTTWGDGHRSQMIVVMKAKP